MHETNVNSEETRRGARAVKVWWFIPFVVLGSLLLVLFWPAPEPTYGGKSLSDWLDQYNSTQMKGMRDTNASVAVWEIGTNALPYLIKMLQAEDSIFKEKLMQLASRQKMVPLKFTTAPQEWHRASTGYLLLGRTAKSQVPDLVNVLTNSKVTEIRRGAANALGNIGEEAKSAIPALLISAKDQDTQLRNSSLWALSQIRGDPELVVPVLIAALDDPFRIARENAAIGLAKYGPLASNALPALVRSRKTNKAADYALGKIAPDSGKNPDR